VINDYQSTGGCVQCSEHAANSEYFEQGSGTVLQVCHSCREGLEYDAMMLARRTALANAGAERIAADMLRGIALVLG